jgi:hypothetical protein|tara:strand:+ start:1529 stop:1684 length:156 start_codon:yes stop_codon:yes gene_type:complete
MGIMACSFLVDDQTGSRTPLPVGTLQGWVRNRRKTPILRGIVSSDRSNSRI